MTRLEIFLLRLGISPPKRSGMLWSAQHSSQHRSTGSPCTCRQRSGWTIVRAIAPVRRPRLRTAWLPGVQPERSPGAAAELGPCLRGQVLRDSESHHRHPGGRFPNAQRLSQGLLPAQVASTSGYRIPKKPQGRKRSSSGQAKTPTTSDHGAGPP